MSWVDELAFAGDENDAEMAELRNYLALKGERLAAYLNAGLHASQTPDAR